MRFGACGPIFIRVLVLALVVAVSPMRATGETDASAHDDGGSAARVDELVDRVEELQRQLENLQRDIDRGDRGALPDRGPDLDLELASDGGYGEDVDLAFWVWLTYLQQSDPTRSTFWAWEVQMDATKTFTDRLAGGFDLAFVDTDNGARVTIKQAMLSAVLSEERGTVLTLGKFNAPFGIEHREFWDRYTGSTSLLFRAMPQDLTGAIVTQPIGDTGLSIQPFVVNGWDQNLADNTQPSVGLVTAWEPTPDLRFAMTHYYGPELPDNVSDKLYLLVGESRWYITSRLFLAVQGLFGTTESPEGRLSWNGATAIGSLDLGERWRAFGRWSYLDDTDGFIHDTGRRRQEVGLGAAHYLHPMVELRAEYRRDFVHGGSNRHSGFAHVTFGF